MNSASDAAERPTNVRYLVLLAATLTAFFLYLDRVCIGFVGPFMQEDLGLTDQQLGWVLSAFFWSYALAQVPTGWLSDKFGARALLTVYCVGWSLLTITTGLATGFATLLAFRLGCGLAQAGAYPTCGGVVSKWIPFSARGGASSIVAFGGRTGGAAAQLLTPLAMIGLGALLIGTPGASWWISDKGQQPMSWRATLVVYGLAGMLVAAWYWRVFRNRPEEHPRCNAAEQRWIAHGRPKGTPSPHGKVSGVPIVELVSSLGMWLMCASQFCTNVGWVFLITWLPRYLEQVYQVPAQQRGVMAMIPLVVGMVGTVFGGSLTDWATRRFGLRWGRSLPLAATRFLAMSGFLACLLLHNPWGATAAFAVVAFATDTGTGATWAFMQDVGGRNVGAVLGWGNMWGNLGAAVAPVLMPWVLSTFDTNGDWHEAFMVCAGAFLLAGLAALCVDATRPVVPAEQEAEVE